MHRAKGRAASCGPRLKGTEQGYPFLVVSCSGVKAAGLPWGAAGWRVNGMCRQTELDQRGCPQQVDADGPEATTWTHQAEACSLVQYLKVRLDVYSNSGTTAAFDDLAYTVWDRVITSTG